VRSILYRFPNLVGFEQMIGSMGETELELGVPAGEIVEDGEWVLAIFDLGPGHRATSAAARAANSPEGPRLIFEPRDWHKLADFAQTEAQTAPQSSRAAEQPAGDLLPQTARSAAVTARSGTGSRVLIVDDDPDIRDVVSIMLESVGLEVSTVTSAEEALSVVRADSFDLLVLDWNLPRMTGIELCRIIRKEAGLAVLPVLFLTANASSQDMVDAFASGADDYVVKPFRAPELGARIFSLLRRTRAAG
jgi:two-component system phosphate regulon response regulator PhoB